MASITTRRTGSRAVQFTGIDGKRRTVSLGRLPARQAAGWPGHIEAILQAQRYGGAVPDQTAAWITALGDEQHERLAQAGLLVSRRPTMPAMAERLERHLRDREQAGEIKPSSIVKLRQTAGLLVEHFGRTQRLERITPKMARAWSVWLVRDRGLSKATQRIHHGNARSMYRAVAGRRAENPFEGLPARTTASDYRRFVTEAEIERVIEQAPTAEWRLLLGLARYAGLRCPSETHLLSVGDIDFDRRRMVVRSPKTERHEGHESRLVPIDPRLLRLLLDRLETMEPGEDRLISGLGVQSSRERSIRRFCLRAGVEPWLRAWQTLRSSAEIDWAQRFPQFAVSRWIGHSMQISERHYANHVPDEIFDRATGVPDPAKAAPKPSRALQNALQRVRAAGRSDANRDEQGINRKSDKELLFEDLRPDARTFGPITDWSGGGSNP
ncbi:MAG: tyrosine-type recombinase/integrase [Phycisphaeraceae bacterium]|nr:tyrosine-type recombinase/integrase [Phycisphaeraceae bacterium]